MSQMPDEPKLHVDSEWKAQAEAEREKLRSIDSQRRASAEDAAEALPPADFRSIVGLLATQALGGLGAYGDPESRKVVIDLPAAQFAIDLLDVLAEKTKGNLSSEESKELTVILTELRARFVHFAQLVAAQAAQGRSPVTGGSGNPSIAPSMPPAKGEAPKSKLIIPG